MHRWKFSVLAAAAIVSTGLFTADVHALALGQIHVRSALGEPLRADIDLPQVSAAEAESLKASTAAPDVYRAQGLEYTPSVNDIRVQFQRRPDGTGVLRLSSSKAINDPFIDLVIDATWASGHIVRSYTMLLDPPEMRRPAAPQTTAPQITSQDNRFAERSEQAPSAIAPAPAPAPRNLPQAQERRTPAPTQRVAPAPVAESAGGGDEVRVRTGETAGRIAGAHRPAGVSLDQMLVAMMRANPDAFINGNVNRLRAGTVLQMPTEAQAQAVTAGEAKKIINAQSRDFNEFRRRLATNAPSVEVATPQRAAKGSVQSQVDDQKPATASSDKLTLSKGGVQAAKKDEKLAQDRQSNQNAERMAELSKNISELNKVGAAAGTPAAAGGASKPADVPAVATVPATVPGTSPAPAPTAPVPAPAASSEAPAAAATTAAASAAADAASAAVTAASSAVDAASAAAVAASDAASAPTKKKRVVAPPPPPPEPTFFESLTEDPMVLGGIGAVLLALLGLGGYKLAQRRKAAALAPSDSSIMDSSLAPDSFFGASGGQRVDTANSGLSTGSSSLAYSPSQLDAGEVDPVAEADVYLAYGRDLQAEEILREAVRVNPERGSIHVKLAEIYAKRQDRKALEAQARELFTLTQGQGADWARVADLGRVNDPENPFYQQSAARAAGAAGVAAAGVAAAAVVSRSEHLDLDAPSTLPVQFHSPAPTPAPAAALDDLDLDLNLGGSLAPEPAPQNHQWTPPIAPSATAPEPVAKLPDFELPSLSLDTPTAPAPFTPPTAPAPAAASNGLDFQLDDLSFTKPAAAPAAEAESPSPYVETTARQPLEFDLNALSLDLHTPTRAGSLTETTAPAPMGMASGAPIPEDPLSTKLALAEEFNAIGDSEGARTLVEEVIAEASGDLKLRAQQLLTKLG
ncbi:hypothetical protein G7048_17500 [Diaphorobacter sp. HDW4B]|uniref:FimV/HubP family polar landmark protein n=1 Tax=Diaphorobacter sp. HDW4B TaxID=2714925 RepID=UPI00140A4DC7|nr:FimV/HubP family polar landmark protein [Diaphorobacter sp. HDW4B]QIL71992.1 hypothetical protein G7048_17500 [Diaphorobacter sp. HDW4B]